MVFAAVVTLALFTAAEVVLRGTGFARPISVDSMRFAFPMDEENRLAPEPFLRTDPELFWTPIPGVLGHNSRGTMGPEFAVPKPEGVIRIVCMGDSCTHFGPDSYPDRLRRLLEAWKPGRFEVINAGVIGYTSHQGEALLRTRVVHWQPDLVTVYFGWNDHWLARGLNDRQQSARGSRGGGALVRTLGQARLVQLATWGLGGLAPAARDQPRVSVEQFGENLRAHAELGRSVGAEVWFITAPSAMDLGVPRYLMESGEVVDAAAVPDLHQRYVNGTLLAAAACNTIAVDLAGAFDANPDKRRLFVDDHIHLSDEGQAQAAMTLFDRIQQWQPTGKAATSRPQASATTTHARK